MRTREQNNNDNNIIISNNWSICEKILAGISLFILITCLWYFQYVLSFHQLMEAEGRNKEIENRYEILLLEIERQEKSITLLEEDIHTLSETFDALNKVEVEMSVEEEIQTITNLVYELQVEIEKVTLVNDDIRLELEKCYNND